MLVAWCKKFNVFRYTKIRTDFTKKKFVNHLKFVTFEYHQIKQIGTNSVKIYEIREIFIGKH